MNTDYKNIILLMILAFLMCFAVYLIAPPVNAYTYVHQGDSINQSETYDLSGVYGFSGELGWWKNWYEEGDDHIEPDVIMDLNTMRYKMVYIDEKWKIGNWYQWDGIGKTGRGNSFVFRVNGTYKPTAQPNNTTVNGTATITATIPPTTTVPTPTPSPVITTPKVITPTPSPTFPKAKGLPLPIGIVVVAVIGAGLVWRRT